MPRESQPGHARPRAFTAALAGAAALALVAGVASGLMGAARLGPDAAAEAAPSDTATTPSATPTASSTAAEPQASASASPSPTPTGDPDVEFTLVAAGDVLTHGPVNDSATTADGYDYAALMDGVRPYIEGADIALCPLEVPVSPAGVAPSGYPIFSAPSELVRDLAEVGWDGCSTASNHSVDKGAAGVESTLVALERYGLQSAGTARSADEAAQTSFYYVRSGTRTVKVANISFSYGTNGMPVGSPWEVNLFDADDAEAGPIIAAAEAARADGADVVVASVHCCVEYRAEPSSAQRDLVEQIAASGAVDLYVGHHAHVPQPIELIEGGPTGDGMWTAFGLGNFLSNQSSHCCVAETSNGVLLAATFTVSPDGTVAVDAEWTAVTVDRLDSHAMHALTDVAEGVGTLSEGEVADRLARVRAAVGDEAAERATPIASLAEQMYPRLRDAG